MSTHGAMSSPLASMWCRPSRPLPGPQFQQPSVSVYISAPHEHRRHLLASHIYSHICCAGTGIAGITNMTPDVITAMMTSISELPLQVCGKGGGDIAAAAAGGGRGGWAPAGLGAAAAGEGATASLVPHARVLPP